MTDRDPHARSGRLLAAVPDPALAHEFLVAPLTLDRSPELERLLAVLRTSPLPGREVLVRVDGGYRVCILPPRRGLPPTPVDEVVHGRNDGERAVFRRRWERLFGAPCPGDPG